MMPLLSGCVLLLAMGCPALALASAPTPQGIADIQRLLGFDVLTDHVWKTKFDGMEQFRSLAPDQRSCLFGSLRAQFIDAAGRGMGDMFGDQETIAAWIRFSATPGGSRMVEAMRATMTAPVTGLPAPDMAAVQAALDPGQMADLSVFEQSPAADVLKKKFPDAWAVDEAEIKRAVERCGIVPGKP